MADRIDSRLVGAAADALQDALPGFARQPAERDAQIAVTAILRAARAVGATHIDTETGRLERAEQVAWASCAPEDLDEAIAEAQAGDDWALSLAEVPYYEADTPIHHSHGPVGPPTPVVILRSLDGAEVVA